MELYTDADCITLDISRLDTIALKIKQPVPLIYQSWYVYENELSENWNKPIYIYNVSTEAFHQYVSEKGLLSKKNKPLSNHNTDIEAFDFSLYII